MANTLEEAAQVVAAELVNNPNGAFGMAVRFASRGGVTADQIMARAMEIKKSGGANSGGAAFEPVDVDWPTADDLEAGLLAGAEEQGGLGPDALVLVPLLVQLIVDERNRMLTMLGVINEQ